jgi:hypothetical protein
MPLKISENKEERRMKRKNTVSVLLAAGTVLFGLAGIGLKAQQNKDTVKVPGGLALSEFKGYEDWQPVTPSLTDGQHVIRLIVANPVMIKAYREGIPSNGKPFPDGSKIAKMEWVPKSITDQPFSASVPDTITGPFLKLELIEKDSKRFADTHGWGYADFEYEAASDTFRPGTTTDKPPQGNDAKCGASCHNLAASKDFIFSIYPKR